jgi:Ran GTPase-activating protein (RanGAP) involved in mRNA processing and transport
LSVTLESLDLSFNKSIDRACYKHFGEQVLESEKFQKLSSLSLEANMIGDETLSVILGSLKHNLGVTFLNLSQNNITELGAKTIKHFLSANNTIRVLFLHWNKLGLQGSKRIAKALVTNSVLQVLDLSFC